MKTTKKFWGIATLMFVSLICLISLLVQNSPVQHPERFTNPLRIEDIKYLCSLFSLSPDDKRCQEDSVVYAPDFSENLVELSRKGELGSYTQWQEKFGQYQSYCQPNKIGVYQCDYDFHGDDVFVIYVFFDANNNDKVKDWGFLVSDD